MRSVFPNEVFRAYTGVRDRIAGLELVSVEELESTLIPDGSIERDMAVLMERTWNVAERGVAINMPSTNAPQHTSGRHDYDPTQGL